VCGAWHASQGRKPLLRQRPLLRRLLLLKRFMSATATGPGSTRPIVCEMPYQGTQVDCALRCNQDHVLVFQACQLLDCPADSSTIFTRRGISSIPAVAGCGLSCLQFHALIWHSTPFQRHAAPSACVLRPRAASGSCGAFAAAFCRVRCLGGRCRRRCYGCCVVVRSPMIVGLGMTPGK
jgi:hypothetical protein